MCLNYLTPLRLLFHEPSLVSEIKHFQFLDHGSGTAFCPTYDSLTLPFSSPAGRTVHTDLIRQVLN